MLNSKGVTSHSLRTADVGDLESSTSKSILCVSSVSKSIKDPLGELHSTPSDQKSFARVQIWPRVCSPQLFTGVQFKN